MQSNVSAPPPPPQASASGPSIPIADGSHSSSGASSAVNVTTTTTSSVGAAAAGEEVVAGSHGGHTSSPRGSPGLSMLEIEKQVGSGTYGMVYLARHRVTGEALALKKIKLDKERDREGFPVTAVREIKILNALKHVNIVDLKQIVTVREDDPGAEELREGHGICANDIFMVFEYADFDLAGILASPEVNLTPDHIKSYMKQLLTGVHYMHANNIMHRDIKGANILVTRDNCLKIADWGLARSFSGRNQNFSNGNKVVTLWYRAPELLLGTQAYTTAIDMWSVGCLFAELLVRKPLFPGATEIEELELIYQLCGTPSGETADELSKCPNWSKMQFEKQYPNNMAKKFASVDGLALDLLQRILNMNPTKRFSAFDAMQEHNYFWCREIPHWTTLPQFRIESGGHEFEARQKHADLVRQQAERHASAQAQKAQAAQLAGRGGRLSSSAGRVVVRAARPTGPPTGQSKFKLHGKVDTKTLGARPLGTSSSSSNLGASAASSAASSATSDLRSFSFVPPPAEGGAADGTAVGSMDVEDGGEEAQMDESAL